MSSKWLGCRGALGFLIHSGQGPAKGKIKGHLTVRIISGPQRGAQRALYVFHLNLYVRVTLYNEKFFKLYDLNANTVS